MPTSVVLFPVPLRRLLAYLTALLHFSVFVLPAQAAPITDPLAPQLYGAKIDRTAAGTPLININRPNAAGLSINRLPQLDIDPVGLILNNATTHGVSLLGGPVQANPNLGQTSARTILTEINGPLPSLLAGPIEIYGTPAWLIIANPNGLTCNGCGTLNTPRLTLATARIDWRDAQGRPLDPTGDLDTATAYTLTTAPGSVLRLERGGLEGTRAQIDLIAGQLTLDGPLRAGDNPLTLRAGPGTWNPNTGAWQPNSTDPTHTDPTAYRIDATTFGAISAGQIDILITGQGAGVRTAADLAARTADLTLRADGQIQLATNYAARNLTLTAGTGDITLTDNTTARAALTLDAGHTIHTQALLESGEALTLTARQGDITLNGPAQTQARLTLDAHGNLTAAGTLLAGQDLTARAGDTLRLQSDAQSGAATTLTAARNLILHGPLRSAGPATLTGVQHLATFGRIDAGGDLTLTGHDIQIRAPLVTDRRLTLNANDLLLAGDLAAGDGVILNAANLTLTDRPLNIAGNLDLDLTGSLLLSAPLTITGDAHLSAPTTRIHADLTTGGSLTLTTEHATLDGALTTGGNLNLTAATFEHTGPTRVGGNALINIADSLDHPGTLQVGGALELTTGGALTLGTTQSGGNLTLGAAGPIQINGDLTTAANLTAHTPGDLKIDGLLQANQTLNLTAGDPSHPGTGHISIGGPLIAGSTATLNAGADLTLNGPTYLLGGGTLSAGDTLLLANGGYAGATLAANAQHIQTRGNLGIDGDLTLTAGDDIRLNQSGADTLIATGALTATAAGALQLGAGGRLQSLQNAALTAAALDNAGQLATTGNLTVTAATWHNTGNGAIGANLTTNATLNNTATLYGANLSAGNGGTNTGILSAAGNLSLGQYWNNTGAISANTIGINHLSNTGTLSAASTLTINGSLSNSAGALLSAPELNVYSDSALYNGGTLSGSTVTLSGAALTNTGFIQSATTLTVNTTGALQNLTGARLEGRTLNLGASGLNNQGELIATAGDATLHLGSGGYSAASGARLIAPGSITLDTTGNFTQAAGAALLADNAITITAANIANAGDIAGTFNPQGVATLTLNTPGSLTHQGTLHTSGTATLNAGAYNAAGGLINSQGDITITAAGAYNPSGETVNTLGTYTLNIPDLFLDIDDSWTNASARVNFGRLTNYGSVNLTGAAAGHIDNLTSVASADGPPPDDYHASCPPGLTDCVALRHDIINSRANANIGSFAGSIYNESSYANLGGGSYEPAWTKLLVTWQGTNADSETVEITTEHLDPQGPHLYGSSGGTIDIVGPYPGVIIGDDLSLTGGDLINADPSDLSAIDHALATLGHDLGSAPPVPGGAAPILTPPDLSGAVPLYNRPDTVRYSTRNPDLLLAINASTGLRPTTPKNPQPPLWADLSLPSGTIHAQTLNLDLSGHLLNLGAISADGYALINADKTLANLGKIDSEGTLLLASADITNRGSLDGGALIVKGGNLTNTGHMGGTDLLMLDLSGNLIHKTEVGGERADITSGGDLILAVGGNATIHNADVSADGDLIANIKGNLDVTAQATTTQTTSTNSVESTTTWESATLSAGANLILTTGGDMNLQAASLKADGDMGLVASGKLNITGVTDQHHRVEQQQTQQKLSTTQSFDAEHTTTFKGSTLQAGGNLALAAGDDLNSTGTAFTAGGNIDLYSKGNITLAAGKSDTLEIHDTRKNTRVYDADNPEGVTGATRTDTATHSKTDTQANTFQAGGRINLQSDKDLHSEGSQFKSGGATTLDAKGNMTLLAAYNTDTTVTHSETTATSNFGLRTETTAAASTLTQSQRANTTHIDAGGDVTLTAGKNLTGEGLAIATPGKLAITAGTQEKGTLTLLAAHNNDVSYTTELGAAGPDSTNPLTSGYDNNHRDQHFTYSENRTAQGSQFNVGGTATLTATGDLNAQALHVDGAKKLTLKAGGDINLTATTDEHRQGQTSRAVEQARGEPLPTDTAQDAQRLMRAGLTPDFTGADNTYGTVTDGRYASTGRLRIGDGRIAGDNETHTRAAQGADFTGVGSVTVQAGGELNSQGTHIDADGPVLLQAEKGIHLTATTDLNHSLDPQGRYSTDTTTRGNDIHSKDTLTVKGGGDSLIEGGRLRGEKGVDIDITGTLTLVGTVDTRTQHDIAGYDTLTTHSETWQGVSIQSGEGANTRIHATGDLTSFGSRIDSGGALYIGSTEGKLNLLAGQDSQSQHYEHNIRSRTSDDLHTQGVGNQIHAKGGITLQGATGIVTQASDIEAGEGVHFDAPDVLFALAKNTDSHSETRIQDKTWTTTTSDQGSTRETYTQNRIATGSGELTYSEGQRQRIELGANLNESTDAALAKFNQNPDNAWANALSPEAGIDTVTLNADSWKNKQRGPSFFATAVIATAAMGLSVNFSPEATGALTGSQNLDKFIYAAGTNLAVSGTANLLFTGDISQAITSDTLKGALIAGLSASANNVLFGNDGLLVGENGLFGDLSFDTHPVTDKMTSPGTNLNTPGGIARFGAQQLLQNTTGMLISRAFGQGGDFADVLRNSFVNTLSAAGFKQIGDLPLSDGGPGKVALHALMGGLIARASGEDFATGAIAAGANEALVGELDKLMGNLTREQRAELLSLSSQFIGMVAVKAQNPNADVSAILAGGSIANSGTQYNRMLHEDEKRYVQEQAQDDAYKQLKLTAAACARAYCSAQYTVGSDQYNYYRGLEDWGNSTELALERDQIAQQIQKSGGQMFQYTLGDHLLDMAKRIDNDNQLTTRALGGLQWAGATAGMVTGVALTTAGAVSCPVSGVGCAVAAGGVFMTSANYDQARAASNAVIFGTATGTVGGYYLQQLGLSAGAAELTYSLVGMSPAAAEALMLRQTANAASAYNAMARASYAEAGAAKVIPGFSSVESGVINEAKVILGSNEMAKIQAAHAAGVPVEVNIGGRLIQYEPGLSASGMTMFGENGFLIGKEAFSSSTELQKTILHELQRLSTSQSSAGVSGALAAQETKAAFDFAERASKYFGGGAK